MDIFDILGIDPIDWPDFHRVAKCEPLANEHFTTINLIDAQNRNYDLIAIRKSDSEQSNIEAFKLRVVIAPIKKDNIDIQIDSDGLTIQSLANENDNASGNDYKIYSGISNKPFKITVPFAFLVHLAQRGPHKNHVKIVTDAVRASVSEGVLEAYIPVEYTTTTRTVPLVSND